MPHVVIKLLAGRSEPQKQRLAEAVTRVVMAHAGCDENAVSVGIEDVAAGDWTSKVFVPDIRGKAASLYKKPGYADV